MASTYPTTADAFTNPAGTQTLDNPTGGHAQQHSDANDAIENLETTLGTTAGTSVIQYFAAGQFAVRHTGVAATGTLVQTLVGGTYNSFVAGTPAITGGTSTNITLTTPTFSAGAVNTNDIADRAVTNRKLVFNRAAGTTGTSSITTTAGTFVELTGGSINVVADVASDLWISFSAIASGAGGNPLYGLVINGTTDSTWTDVGSWFHDTTTVGGFTARRAGFAAGTHTIRMQWRTSGGTATTNKFELIAYPIGTS